MLVVRFWMKTDNTAEETGEVRPTGETIYRSVSGVTRRGYELEMSGEVAAGWQVQGSYVMNSSSLSTSDTVPKYQFKLASSYRLPGALQNLNIGANVNNLFDKTHMSGMRDFGRVQYTWGAPRSVSINMRYQF